MTVIAYGEKYPCSRAVKGDNFIHLYDEKGMVFASFEGINSFGGYQIIDGEWESPAAAPSVWDELEAAYREGVNSA